MKPAIVGVFCAVLCSGSGAAAQGFVEGLEAAQARIDAKQWKEALEFLLSLHFYGRLLAGETDKLAAFTAAKKALRAKYTDPFHWAPFPYMGAPE